MCVSNKLHVQRRFGSSTAKWKIELEVKLPRALIFYRYNVPSLLFRCLMVIVLIKSMDTVVCESNVFAYTTILIDYVCCFPLPLEIIISLRVRGKLHIQVTQYFLWHRWPTVLVLESSGFLQLKTFNADTEKIPGKPVLCWPVALQWHQCQTS